jgi:hypothetical protein
MQKLKKLEDDTKKLSKEEGKMKHNMLLLEKNMSEREELCKQCKDSLVKGEELSKLLKREVCCLSDAANDQKQACALVIVSAKVNSKELREREFMCKEGEGLGVMHYECHGMQKNMFIARS